MPPGSRDSAFGRRDQEQAARPHRGRELACDMGPHVQRRRFTCLRDTEWQHPRRAPRVGKTGRRERLTANQYQHVTRAAQTAASVGMTREEIFSDYPALTEEDIRACLSYAADRERGVLIDEQRIATTRNGSNGSTVLKKMGPQTGPQRFDGTAYLINSNMIFRVESLCMPCKRSPS